MILEIIAFSVIGLLVLWAIFLWLDVYKLNKLRRKYVEEKDESRNPDFNPTFNNPKDRRAGTGNPEIERAFEQVRVGGIDSEPTVVQSSSLDRSPETERRGKSDNGVSRRFRRI